MKAARTCVHAGYAAPAIDIAAALEVAEAIGAEREVAAELLGGVMIGFNRAMRKRDA